VQYIFKSNKLKIENEIFLAPTKIGDKMSCKPYFIIRPLYFFCLNVFIFLVQFSAKLGVLVPYIVHDFTNNSIGWKKFYWQLLVM
jgi:hypothetical protein